MVNKKKESNKKRLSCLPGGNSNDKVRQIVCVVGILDKIKKKHFWRGYRIMHADADTKERVSRRLESRDFVWTFILKKRKSFANIQGNFSTILRAV